MKKDKLLCKTNALLALMDDFVAKFCLSDDMSFMNNKNKTLRELICKYANEFAYKNYRHMTVDEIQMKIRYMFDTKKRAITASADFMLFIPQAVEQYYKDLLLLNCRIIYKFLCLKYFIDYTVYDFDEQKVMDKITNIDQNDMSFLDVKIITIINDFIKYFNS